MMCERRPVANRAPAEEAGGGAGEVRDLPGTQGGEPMTTAQAPVLGDTARLVAWMDGQGLGTGAPLEHRFLSGGSQNEIYEIRRGDLRCVLRIPPPAAPADRDNGIVREWRALREAFPDGVDVVVDPVGGHLSEPALRGLRWGGRFVTVGYARAPCRGYRSTWCCSRAAGSWDSSSATFVVRCLGSGDGSGPLGGQNHPASSAAASGSAARWGLTVVLQGGERAEAAHADFPCPVLQHRGALLALQHRGAADEEVDRRLGRGRERHRLDRRRGGRPCGFAAAA